MSSFAGTVVSIHTAEEEGGPVTARSDVQAYAGRGLEGDRYLRKAKPHRNVTLIETETIEALRRDYGIEIAAKDTRRNIATRGVALNHLVGRVFRVGQVRLRGARLCEPCARLEEATVKGVLNALVHRGGLRAEILDDGPIRVGDAILPWSATDH